MNDTTAQLLVDRLVAGLPEPATARIPELLRDGQRSRRRRRRTALGAAALAVGVVVAGVALAPRSGPDSPNPAPANEMPAPPAGMRWVGYADQVVAVPVSWTTGDAVCNVPQSDTVYLEFPGEFFCATPPDVPDVSSVRIYPGTTGPYFTVESPDFELEERIQRSQREVPDGWTTVPWHLSGSAANMQREARQAGIEAQFVKEYDSAPRNRHVSTVPSAGSPIQRGDQLSVVIHVHRPMMIEQVFAAPGDELNVYFPERSSRGTDYVMTLQSGSLLPPAYQLSPALAGREGTPTWRPLQDALPVADIAVGGVGPDRVVVPDLAIPGLYSICIENMPEPLCDVVTVTE